MRLVAGLLIATVTCSSAAIAQEVFPPVEKFLNPMVVCDDTQMPELCAYTLDEMPETYAAAQAGDRIAQRNLASCLRSGCWKVVIENPMLSCAWRIVILESGHLTNDDRDIEDYQRACLSLDALRQRAALRQAEAMLDAMAEDRAGLD